MLTVDGAETGVLFVGDDWAEDHHDIELQDGSGRVLRTARVPEGVAGMARFHELIATFLPDDADPAQVLVCIETDRGPWVRALVAAGYRVFGVNPFFFNGTATAEIYTLSLHDGAVEAIHDRGGRL